jgi:hypothetical protein
MLEAHRLKIGMIDCLAINDGNLIGKEDMLHLMQPGLSYGRKNGNSGY